MIKLLKQGRYIIGESKHGTRILCLDEQNFYSWIKAPNIGTILTQIKNYSIETIISTGSYGIYAVEDDPRYVDLQHLELETGKNRWQGYLLLTGLPAGAKKRSRIIATRELITQKSKEKAEPEAICNLDQLESNQNYSKRSSELITT